MFKKEHLEIAITGILLGFFGNLGWSVSQALWAKALVMLTHL